MTSQLVYIEWIDSCSQYGWRGEESATEMTPIECQTVGFLVSKTKHYVNVSASHAMAAGNYDSPISIPRKAITKYKSFELPE